MNENQNDLQKTIDKLDAELPKADAFVKLEQYGGGPDEGRIIATRNGYLRLGIEFLKAGIRPLDSERPNDVKVDIEYLLDPDSDISFDWFERRTDIQRPAAVPMTPGRIGRLVLNAFILFWSLSGLYGAYALMNWRH